MIDPKAPDYSQTPVAPSRRRYGYRPASTSVAPCVSIVTPVFEPGPELLETAQSIASQSLQQWEWLIVDDGTVSDAAARRISDCVEADARVRCVRLPVNSGLSAARNAGVAAAKAPYIALLDGDDLLEPTALEKWWWFLESAPRLAFTKGYSIGFGAASYLWTHGFHEGEAFLEANRVDVTSLIRADTFRQVGGFDESNRDGLEDWEFWLRCADAGLWGGTIPEYLNWYRRHDDHTRWSNLSEERTRVFRETLQARFPRLWAGGFPSPEPAGTGVDAASMRGRNRLERDGRRLLLIEHVLNDDSVSRWNHALLERLTRHGWHVTVVATTTVPFDEWPAFTRITPDVFILSHFVQPADAPVFLDYLITSRQFDAVCVSRSELGRRLLPRLANTHSDVVWMEMASSSETPTEGIEQIDAVRAAIAPGDTRVVRAVTIEPDRRADADMPLRAVIAALCADRQRLDRLQEADRLRLKQSYESDRLRMEERQEADRTARDARIRELESWSAQQQEGIDWLNAERARLTALIEDSSTARAELEARIRELEAWIAQQQEAIDWLNAERARLSALLNVATD